MKIKGKIKQKGRRMNDRGGERKRASKVKYICYVYLHKVSSFLSKSKTVITI